MSASGDELSADLTLEVVVDDVVGDLDPVSRRADRSATVFERGDQAIRGP